MNEQRIREIANESSTYAENSVDYYSGIVDGLTFEAKILKARDLKFAELIVKECLGIVANADMTELEGPDPEDVLYVACKQIKEHFGVEE